MTSQNPWELFKSHTKPLKNTKKIHDSFVYKSPKPLVRNEAIIFDRPLTVELKPISAMPRKTKRTLHPQARIDLHGMTLDQAYQHLVRFIKYAYEQKYKTVLVITGKGAVSALTSDGPATLRFSLPSWAQSSP